LKTDGRPALDEENLIFTFFNEVGIVSQLSQAYLNRHLPDGMHASHFATLNHLHRRGDGRMPQSIASAMQVTKGTMTHTLGVLEGRGLIEFRVNPNDGRSKMVFLTDAGRSFRETAVARVTASMAAVSPLLDGAALASAIPILRAVRRVLDDERSGRRDEA
jgi:DNA-binding MarR family transcriptional regulator